VREAARDFYYLLNRGYSRKSALHLVASRYDLSHFEKALLNRCVHEEEYNRSVLEKLSSSARVHVVVVDFYNVTTTIAEHLEGGELYRCTDHVIRDNAIALGRSRKEPEALLEAFKLAIEAIEDLGAVEAVIVADKQRSHSKSILGRALEVARERLSATPILADKADIAVVEQCRRLGALAASSDRLILERVGMAVDLVDVVLRRRGGSVVLDFRELMGL